MKTLCLLSIALITVAGCTAFCAEGGLESAVTAADLDFANCNELPANPRTEPFSVTDEALASFLRIAGPLPPHTAWRTGAGDEGDQYIRLAFTRPVAVGTIIAVTNGVFGVLRPEAQYPGEVTRDADWLPVEDPHPGGLVRVIPLPPGLETRALRVSFRSDPPVPGRRSQLGGLRLLRGRYLNLAWDAVPLASSEAGQSEAEREQFGRAGLNDGQPGDLQGGQWRSVPGKALSETEPAWAALLWERREQIAAVGFINAFARTVAVDAYAGPDAMHPLTAPATAWQEHARAAVPVPWRPMYCELLVPLEAPVQTRSVRVRFVEGLTTENQDVEYNTKGDPVHARLGELMVLRDLGDQPLSVAVAQGPVEYEVSMSDNRGQDAVPAAKAVSVDGDLGEWNRSGGIFMCPDSSLLMQRASAWGYVMYDAEALYVALDVSDPTPLGNQHDPDSEQVLGWGGDCVQVRLVTDRVTHLTTWYSAARDRPVMHVAYGADFDGEEIRNAVAMPGVALAFRARPDGTGYVEEMRLPWSLITTDGQPRGAGAKLALLYDLRWGTRDAPEVAFADNLARGATTRTMNWQSPQTWGELRLSATGSLAQTTPPWLKPRERSRLVGPVKITYDLPREGAPAEGYEVTLAIDDAAGRRVRNLISGVKRQPGENVETWDGLDDLGKLAPPGEYRWKAVYRAPLHLKYEFTVNHAGTPPWLSGTTGGWLSDHCTPQAACAIGGKMFLSAQLAENGHTLIAVDLDGRKLWGAKWLNLAGAQVLATDGKSLYVGSEGGWIGAKLQVNVVDPATYGFHNVIEETYAKPEDSPQLVGLAVRDGKAYLALRKPGVVAVYSLPDADHKTAQKTSEFALAEPGGLAFDAQGDLWAVSGKRVVRVSGGSGEAQVVVAQGLEAPQQLAFDGAGNLYVSDGPPSCQVKVFDAQGRLLRAVGKPGGRRLGRYEPECMDNPQGIAVDAQGRLWVAENSRQPKRVSVWTAEGRLLRAFHGPTRYGGSGYLDATDRTRLHDDGMTFRLDWEKGTWELTDVHYQTGATGTMVFDRPPGRSWTHDGRTFLSNYDYWTSRYIVLYERLATGRIAPLAAAGRAEYLSEHTLSGVAAWADERFAQRRGGRELKDLNFLWSDLNRDEAIQEDELQFVQTPAGEVAHWTWEALWAMWVTEDCGFIMSANGWGPRQYAWKLPVVRWQENGAPVFDPGHPKLIADVERRKVPVYDNVVQSILADSEGRAILVANPITGCDGSGQTLWTYENPWPGVHGSHSAPSYKPAMVIGGMLAVGMARLDGDLGEVFAIVGNKGQVYLFTTDGLLVATLFADCRVGQPWSMAEARRGMLLDDLSLGEEHFGGHFTRTSDGKYYLVVGSNHTSIVEVAGMDTLRRLEGGFSLDATAVARCEQFARERAFEETQRETPKLLAVTHTDKAPVADGELTDWQGVDFAPWQASSGNVRAALAYDDVNLYLACEVSDATPLANKGTDWRLLFKTGDAVDVELGTDPAADPQRRSPVPGDLRLLISAQDDGTGLKPVVVLYRHRVPGTPDAEKTTFSSPWRSEVIDQVTRLDAAQVSVRAAASERRSFVEAAIPLSALGLKPSPGLRLRGDLGALFGDAAGEVTIERSHWANQSVNFTSDVPGEAMAYPNFWGTLEFR